MDETESIKAENKALKCQLTETQQEFDRLLNCLKDAQEEANLAKIQLDMMRGELLSLRGQVTAYKHCIAAMTGTEIPLEVIDENRGMKL